MFLHQMVPLVLWIWLCFSSTVIPSSITKGGSLSSRRRCIIYMILQWLLFYEISRYLKLVYKVAVNIETEYRSQRCTLSKYLHTFPLPAGTWGSILIYRLIIVSRASSLSKNTINPFRLAVCLSPSSLCFLNLQSLYQDLIAFHYKQAPGYWPAVVMLAWQHVSFTDIFVFSFVG